MVEVDAKEHFMPTTSVEDDVVVCGLARCVMGHFEMKLSDGAKGSECMVRRWVEVHGGVLSWSRRRMRQVVLRFGTLRCSKNLAMPRRLSKTHGWKKSSSVGCANVTGRRCPHLKV